MIFLPKRSPSGARDNPLQYHPLSMKETSKKAGHRKPVQYRARHKKLRDLREEDTKHGFEQRIKVESSLSRAPEPVFCGVWRDGRTESIELNSSNYRFAATKLKDNVRVGRSSSSRHGSATTADTSPSSSTYSADMALLEGIMDSPYRDTFLQLTGTHNEQSLQPSENDYYPQPLGPPVLGGQPMLTPAMQPHIHLPIIEEENLNIEVSGYTGFGNIVHANQGIPAASVPIYAHTLHPYLYHEEQYPTQGLNTISNQPTSTGWEPAPNFIWDPLMLEPYLYDQGPNAPNIPPQFADFNFSTMDDTQYMQHPNQPNIMAQHGYYSGP